MRTIDLMSRKDAANYIGVSPRWLSTHIEDGPVITRIGNRVFYLRDDLNAYIIGCRETIGREDTELSSPGPAPAVDAEYETVPKLDDPRLSTDTGTAFQEMREPPPGAGPTDQGTTASRMKALQARMDGGS